VLDAAGDSLANVRKATKGTITMNVTLMDRTYSMCGWLYKVSESMLSNAWKKRWFVLINGQLQYYNTDTALEVPKNIIPCADVTSIKEETYKGRDGLKISFKTGGSENSWIIDCDELEDKMIKLMWIRKIYRNCVQLPDPTLESAGLKGEALLKRGKGITVTTTTTGENISPVPKTRVPLAKRMSVFGSK